MKAYPVKFEVQEGPEGWQLFALPCHKVGWARIPMSPPRGTPGGALVEFASALYAIAGQDLFSPKDSGQTFRICSAYGCGCVATHGLECEGHSLARTSKAKESQPHE